MNTPRVSLLPTATLLVALTTGIGCRDRSIALAAQADSGVPTEASTNLSGIVNPVLATNGVTDAAGSAAPVELPPVAPQVPASLPAPAKDVIALAHNQMEERLITNYIANVVQPFRLDAEQLVYLKDLGISATVLDSLLSRERELASFAPSEPETDPIADGGAMAMPSPLSGVQTATPQSAPPLAGTATPAGGPISYPGGPVSVNSPQVGPAETVSTPPSAGENIVNHNYFYTALAPYGNWVTIPNYGYVWQPSTAIVNADWRPYYDNGGWVWTDAGWYWNSYYSWGWAPFHYGNWVRAPGRGWCWVPGSVWGPSWVTFRYSSGYCGWAPLPPGAGWRTGVGLTWAGSGISVGFGFSFGAADYCWTPTRYFTAAHCRTYGVYGSHVTQIYNQSTVINNYIVGNNNTVINGGIRPGEISKVTRQEIRPVALTDASRPGPARPVGALPGRTEQLAVYRPAVSPDRGGSPAQAGSRSELRPSRQASPGTAGPSVAALPSRTRPTVKQPDVVPPTRVEIPAGSPSPLGPATRLHSGSSAIGSPIPTTRPSLTRPPTVAPGSPTTPRLPSRPSSGALTTPGTRSAVTQPAIPRSYPGIESRPVTPVNPRSSVAPSPGTTPIPRSNTGRIEPRPQPIIQQPQAPSQAPGIRSNPVPGARPGEPRVASPARPSFSAQQPSSGQSRYAPARPQQAAPSQIQSAPRPAAPSSAPRPSPGLSRGGGAPVNSGGNNLARPGSQPR